MEYSSLQEIVSYYQGNPPSRFTQHNIPTDAMPPEGEFYAKAIVLGKDTDSESDDLFFTHSLQSFESIKLSSDESSNSQSNSSTSWAQLVTNSKRSTTTAPQIPAKVETPHQSSILITNPEQKVDWKTIESLQEQIAQLTYTVQLLTQSIMVTHPNQQTCATTEVTNPPTPIDHPKQDNSELASTPPPQTPTKRQRPKSPTTVNFEKDF